MVDDSVPVAKKFTGETQVDQAYLFVDAFDINSIGCNEVPETYKSECIRFIAHRHRLEDIFKGENDYEVENLSYNEMIKAGQHVEAMYRFQDIEDEVERVGRSLNCGELERLRNEIKETFNNYFEEDWSQYSTLESS